MTKGNILVVDDVPDNLTLLTDLLSMSDYEIRSAQSGPLALEAVRQQPPDLILLDITMPGMNGYTVCERLKADQATRDIPVIFISSSTEVLDKVRAFRVGGVDYVTKPLQIEEVIARVETQLTLYKQRKELEALRLKEKSDYEDLNRMKDQFVRTVSHDLKNPIGLIIGSLDLLQEMEGALTDPEVQELLDVMRRKADFMLAMVTNLLDLARIEAGMTLTLKPVSLTALLNDCQEEYELIAQREGIALTVTPPVPDCEILIDFQQFKHVLSNLLSNAIKYTPEGGQVALVARVETDHALIQVRDTGLGIPPEDLPHLFEKFYRVRRETHMEAEGTGLGLSITKAIVEQHNGRIQVESTLGAGSVFSVILPLGAAVA